MYFTLRNLPLRRYRRSSAFPIAFAFPAMSTSTSTSSSSSTTLPDNVAQWAQRVLNASDPADKVRFTNQAATAWRRHRYAKLEGISIPPHPARPEHPNIVSVNAMPSAKSLKVPTNIFLLHSLAHVELNAIDLCFDTALRFTSQPDHNHDINDQEWWDDWISIASDEARHFSMLQSRLIELGSFYGALPAHGLIWESAEASRDSRRKRIAVGQLVAEARGLDAGPRLADRMLGSGDKQSSNIVRIIADEEIRHVEIGVKWFLKECAREHIDAVKEFHDIAVKAGNFGAFAPPFNEERRAKAGLTPEWYLPVAEIMQKLREERRLQKQRQTDSVRQKRVTDRTTDAPKLTIIHQIESQTS